ncbi:glycosyl transferase group 1 [Tepidanaerobacter syntrophicus]|uniref:glycosyltransferase family 4 protein n=1 Tax=Tepidanaerobacter syntrophicus TaxID=224999 RepID=UPI0022EE69D7|nr:glycosyltransferase family 4 protein [Tepidanaerobacter syntrophicus]GLI18569.1 glycosyl transferase group 1 [Tepidanaerobacter syntrophicus]
MIKVLHVLSDTNVGGAGRYIFNLLSNKYETSFEAAVACPKGGELEKELRERNIQVFPLEGGESSTNMSQIKSLRRIISQEKFDIVHTHASFAGRIAGKMAGAKVVMTRHSIMGGGAGPVKRMITRLISRIFTDKIIAISRAVKINLIESGVPADMITIIYNGIDTTKFECVKGTLRKELNITPDTPIIGMVARLVPEKGYEYAINAFYRVIKDYPNALLVIIGSGSLEKNLKNMCSELGIESNVIFMGYRQDVENLMADFDLFVLSSVSEGLGLSLLEAMALGKPVVATITGGIPEVIKDGTNGLLVQPGNDVYLAESIVKILSDKDLARRLGDEAKKTVVEKFSSKTMIEKTEKVYQEVLQR